MKMYVKYIVFAGVLAATVLSVNRLAETKPAPAVGSVVPRDQAAVEENGPMMLELYTPYCSSCSQMAPLVRDLATTCADEGVSIVQFDISAEENEHLVDELDIDAVPTFVFFDKSGRETARLVGKQTAEALQSRLSDIGGQACGGRT